MPTSATVVLADHKDNAFNQLENLLEPFGIEHNYSDGRGADLRRLEPPNVR